MKPRFRLMLACNDHRNGTFAGHFDGAEILGPTGDRLMAFDGAPIPVRFFLASRCGAPPGFFVPTRRRSEPELIDRGLWVHSWGHYSQWAGNWCWDEFGVDSDNARKFLAILAVAGWGCVEAPDGLMDAWRPLSSRMASVDDVSEALSDACRQIT